MKRNPFKRGLKKDGNCKKILECGDIAPDFELTDINGIEHKLSSLRGSRVLVSFSQFAA